MTQQPPAAYLQHVKAEGLIKPSARIAGALMLRVSWIDNLARAGALQ
jgi:hypothetical protein